VAAEGVGALEVTLNAAELLTKIRARLGRVVLWPRVSAEVARLYEEWKYKKSDDVRTVTYQKIRDAIACGSLTDSHRITDPAQGWVATIEGVDAVGDPLVVSLRMLDEDSCPLEVTSFTIPQK
jgi:hypothetical protein